MLSQTQQSSTLQRDRDMTEYLYDALRRLPGEISGVEVEAAALLNAKRQAQVNLEDAELNATLNAPLADENGKGNADTRKRAIQVALANDPNVKKLRMEVNRYEAELEMNDAEAKSKRREFQAAIALSELHAARINSMYRYQTQQQQNNTQRGNHERTTN